MSSDDDKKGKRSNPWGNVENINTAKKRGAGRRTGGNGGGGRDPGDLDEMLKRARSNFDEVMPGGFGGGNGMLIVIILAILAGLWAVSGFYVVNPGENAVVQRFGAWERTQAEPGLGYHLPSPFETVNVINVEEIRNLNIGFSDVFSRGRSSARREIPEESLMLTSDRNIVDLHLIIQWNIKSAEDYLFNIFAQENTVKKVAESAIREVVGQTDMFPIITTGRAAVAQRTQEIIQSNLDLYESGVNITQVLIDKAEVHPDVQGAFQDVQSAKQDAEEVRNRADAYREDILPKARGKAKQMLQEAEAYKQSTVAKSNGDADRFKSVLKSYQEGKDVTKERMYIETMEQVLRNAEKIIIDQNGEGQGGVVPYLPLEQLNAKKGR